MDTTIPISTSRRVLQLPFESFYTSDIITLIPNVMLIALEAILLAISCIQIIRFCHCPNIFLKKIIHMLIACQLIASIAFELDIGRVLGIHFQPFILFTIQEATFLFSGLAYFTVFLFWVDFNTKVKSPGPGIKFLQTNLFAILIFLFSSCYIGGFAVLNYYYGHTITQGWRLSFKIIWWHLGYYCIITPMQLYYSYKIHKSLDKFYYSYTHSFSKTKKILWAVNFCFILRTLSIITFVGLYHFTTHSEEVFLSTWPAFICFYIIDQILPASIFMFLLRKAPKEHAISEGKLAYLHSNNIDASMTMTGISSVSSFLWSYKPLK